LLTIITTTIIPIIIIVVVVVVVVQRILTRRSWRRKMEIQEFIGLCFRTSSTMLLVVRVPAHWKEDLRT
jgi:hypothetical protein